MSSSFPQLAKKIPRSREEFAYETIKEAILSGDLLPGQKISLTDLANSLGVSIIPVNSAVGRLTSEGLIRQDSHHSPRVQEFSAQATNEVLTIRYHLEELALQLAIPNITENDIVQLHAFLEEMQEAIKQNDHHLYSMVNRTFHMFIYSCSHLPMLCSLIEEFWNKSELNRSRSVFAIVPNMIGHSYSEHLRLVESIEKKDVDTTLEILREHKNYSRVRLLESLEKSDKTKSKGSEAY